MPTTISRRDFLALTAAGLAATGAVGQANGSGKTYAYVGAWTQGRFGTGGGGGITVFELLSDGSLVFRSSTGSEIENLNAGFVAASADGRFLYSTQEVSNLNGDDAAGGGIFSFAINPSDGSLTYLNTQSSIGSYPSMINIDDTGKILVASNHGALGLATRAVKKDGVPMVEKTYDDSTVAIFPINDDGTLAPAADVAILDRIPSPSGSRFQLSPHAHSAVFDPTNRRIVVADKGADRVYSYLIDKENMTIGDPKYIDVAPGVMPRHVTFHPRAPFIFVSYEAEPSLSSFHFDVNTGEMEFVQTVSSISGEGARARPSDIKMHPNGNFVYTATRGSNVISVHRVNETDGTLHEVEIVASGAGGPRGLTFGPSGNHLFVANMDGNSVNTFIVDPETGRITPTGASAEMAKPACIRFAQV